MLRVHNEVLTYGASGAQDVGMTYTDTHTSTVNIEDVLVDTANREAATAAHIASLEAVVNRLTNQLAATRRVHDQRIEDITERLHQEANERDFCSRFDDIMEELGLRRRTREFEVTITATITTTVTVEAADEDDARDKALEEVDLGSYTDGDDITLAVDNVETVVTG